MPYQAAFGTVRGTHHHRKWPGTRPGESGSAIRRMPTPQNKGDIKRFHGFIGYLSKFIPNLSAEGEPLRALLKTDVEFTWQNQQEASFEKLKELRCRAPVLAYYDATKPVQIQCDASNKGLGAVLLQDERPVAYTYTSRSLTETESQYMLK